MTSPSEAELARWDAQIASALVPAHVAEMVVMSGQAEADVIDVRTFVHEPEPWRLDTLRRALPGLRDDTLASFVARAKTTARLDEADFGPCDLPLHALDDAADGELEAADELWIERFEQMYPGALGWISVTRGGYSADGTQALVFRRSVRVPVAGFEAYVLLEREDAEWVAVALVH